MPSIAVWGLSCTLKHEFLVILYTLTLTIQHYWLSMMTLLLTVYTEKKEQLNLGQ